MQLTYTVACLVAYLMHMGAVRQTHGSPPADKPRAKFYTLREIIAWWKDQKCIFPDDSWYKTDLLGYQSGKLKHCQNLDINMDLTKPDINFQYTLCQSLYRLSIQLCNKMFQPFVESCLSPAELEHISLFNKDNNVCSFVYKQEPNDDYNYMRNSTLCNNTCGDLGGFKDICELYVTIFYQYKHSSKCMPQKASNSKPAAPTETDTGKATAGNHIETSDNGAAKKEFTEASNPSNGVESVVLTTVPKTPAPTPNTKESIPSTPQSDGQSAQNKLSTPIENQTGSISLVDVSKEKPMDEAKTTPVLNESTPPITDIEEAEDLATITTTTTILPSTSVQLTSASKQIIESSSKDTPEVINPDTPSTTAAPKKNADATQNNGISNKGEASRETDNTDNKDRDSEEPEYVEEQPNWAKNDENADENQNKKPTKGNVNKEDDDESRGESNKQKKQPQHLVDEDESPSSGHFLAYFLTAVVICISGYVIYHNKQKILAFVIEGRNSGRAGRQRSKDVKYTQLKSNVEEVLPSLEQSATTKNFVY